MEPVLQGFRHREALKRVFIRLDKLIIYAILLYSIHNRIVGRTPESVDGLIFDLERQK